MSSLVQLEPQHSPESRETRQQVLRSERPYIEHFDYAATWGHAQITVDENAVSCSVYRGLERTASKTLDLTSNVHG